MDNDVSRYWVCDREDEPFMERCEDGDWVYFEDYASLAAERDALRAENDLLKAQIEAACEMHPAEPGLLRKQLAQKREPSSNP